VLLPEVSFEALQELFLSNDFARTRPHRMAAEPAYDFIRAAQEEGANIIQDFHESMTVRGGKRYAIIADVCALANTNGGTLFIGINADPRKPITGIADAEQSLAQLEKELSNRISPPPQLSLDIHETGGKKIIVILVARGVDPPYAVDDNKIYVRSESETVLAVRDEIVGLVNRGLAAKPVEAAVEIPRQAVHEAAPSLPIMAEGDTVETAPRTGVEVIEVETRADERYYTMRDLRNGNVVKNVTQKSARRLWHYAIMTFDKLQSDISQRRIQWHGNFGLIQRQKQGTSTRYDLIERNGEQTRYYFGVTDDGIHGPWKRLVGQEDD
jgi:hypothetical protein